MQGGLKIKFPTEVAEKYAKGFDMSLGNFGAPLYGGTLTYGPPILFFCFASLLYCRHIAICSSVSYLSSPDKFVLPDLSQGRHRCLISSKLNPESVTAEEVWST